MDELWTAAKVRRVANIMRPYVLPQLEMENAFVR
jgi:hypothetical protein